MFAFANNRGKTRGYRNKSLVIRNISAEIPNIVVCTILGTPVRASDPFCRGFSVYGASCCSVLSFRTQLVGCDGVGLDQEGILVF